MERREALVAEFQCSGLSAARFAQLAGVRYNTFWTWLKKHGAGVKPSRNRFLRSGSARGYAPSLHLHYRTYFASQASCISTKPNENHLTTRMMVLTNQRRSPNGRWMTPPSPCNASAAKQPSGISTLLASVPAAAALGPAVCLSARNLLFRGPDRVGPGYAAERGVREAVPHLIIPHCIPGFRFLWTCLSLDCSRRQKRLSLARIETSIQATKPCQTNSLKSSSPSVSMRNCPLALVCLSVSTSR